MYIYIYIYPPSDGATARVGPWPVCIYIYEPNTPTRLLNLKLKHELTFINFPGPVAKDGCCEECRSAP